jgi:hypothetical protein
MIVFGARRKRVSDDLQAQYDQRRRRQAAATSPVKDGRRTPSLRVSPIAGVAE